MGKGGRFQEDSKNSGTDKLNEVCRYIDRSFTLMMLSLVWKTIVPRSFSSSSCIANMLLLGTYLEGRKFFIIFIGDKIRP